jgi:hypothetical protein
MTTTFASKLAETAIGQHEMFKNQHEGDPGLSAQIKKYWNDLGFQFSSVTKPWSAVFVSWCVKAAGATSQEFQFAAMHSEFVHKAIANAQANTGVFRGVEITAAGPAIGDILQNNRDGNTFDFNFATANESYPSHSAIVVEAGEDHNGKYVITIGGNESDSIRTREVRLDANGLVIQRPTSPYISLVRDLK